jgi:hypothetical protein
MVKGALEVTEDALHGREHVTLHVEEHLLDRVGDVSPSEGKVLESLGQAAVGSRVTDGGPMLEETFARGSTGVEQGLHSRMSRAY